MKTSPARRVYLLLKKAHDFRSDKAGPPIVIWARILGIVDPSAEPQVTPELEDSVLLALRDFRDEVSEVERSVIDPEATEAVAPIASTARLLTSTTQLYADWAQVKASHLRADFLAGWKWASIYLPATDDNITDESLRAFSAEVDDLERAAEQPDVPASLRRMIRKQIRAIRDALRRYEVRGVGPLRDAVSQGLGDMIRDQAEVQASTEESPAQTSNVISKFKTVWTNAVRICGDMEKLQKGYEIAMHVYEKTLPLLEHIGVGPS